MVTTKDLTHIHAVNSDEAERLLLDVLILIPNDTKHMASLKGDMLKYVHEKSRCYNVCEKGADAKRSSYKKGVEGSFLIGTAINKGGTCFAY
jgi:hypothetical protein